ncbi:ABC transporter permease [Rhodocytophaga rosea]|uniref:ABC transporter permease n=1 Tax=Rhodocytophaga rosea TaxID=2704465 RepID=A0A6C0GTV7_9BACT|nr:FtsX-like permease family protein [Rhodocytophaga rosea]QHT71609.1 ABC transporter permease [Rhodocytophaga rosea]
MNIALFIARRIQHTQGKSFSSTVARIGVASIAIGIAVMIVSFAILGGFKETIQRKIFSFGAHLQVNQFSVNRSFEELPVSTNTDLYQHYQKIPEISSIQVYSHKAGLLKTEEDLLGVFLKGIGKDFNLQAFNQNMVDGKFISFSDTAYSKEIVISRKIAAQLRLKVKDEVLLYFVQNAQSRPRVRKLTVSGIYETGMEEFDESVVLGDIRLIQRLNDWSDTLVGGYEIYLKDFAQLEPAADKVYDLMDFDMQVETIKDKYIQVFDWLSLLNRNVAIFLSLILFVACFNMVAILIILIMERTQMIGILKSVGATQSQVRRIFLLGGVQLITRGLLWGNVLGIGFCALQYYFKLIPLDVEAYYMNTVPIAWDWPIFILVNLAVLLLVTLVLIIPTIIIGRIQPVQALRFD